MCEIRCVNINWVKNILNSLLPTSFSKGGSAETINQGAQTFEKKTNNQLIDVTEGVRLTEEAKRQNLKLHLMVQQKNRPLDRLPSRDRIRKRVEGNLAEFYQSDEKITEEVTERIYEAFQNDSRLKKLFEG